MKGIETKAAGTKEQETKLVKKMVSKSFMELDGIDLFKEWIRRHGSSINNKYEAWSKTRLGTETMLFGDAEKQWLITETVKAVQSTVELFSVPQTKEERIIALVRNSTAITDDIRDKINAINGEPDNGEQVTVNVSFECMKEHFEGLMMSVCDKLNDRLRSLMIW